MIELVKTPTADTFYSLVSACQKEMILCAPYIKMESIKEIIRKKQKESRITVITSANLSNFIQGSSDLSAIKFLLDNDATVLNYQDLHAKIYLFDNSKALITSANMTYSGMYHNYEYGVLIDKNDTIIDKIETDFIEMMDDQNSGEYDLNKISDIEKTIKSIELKGQYEIKEIKGDNTLIVDDISFIIDGLSSWKKDVLLVVKDVLNEEFTLKELYQFKDIFAVKHPNNRFIESKIRQILQQLRDMGLIKFTRSGHYKKLFCINDKKTK